MAPRVPRPFPIVLLLIGLAAAMASCTREAAPDNGIAGTWVMSLDGRPFLVLTLEAEGDHLTGTLARPEQMTTDGRSVSSISGNVATDRVTTDVPRDNTLRLVATAADDPDDSTEFEFSITAPGEALLKPAGAPIEPWPITRHNGTAPDVWNGWDAGRTYTVREPYVGPNAEMADIYKADQAVRQSMDAFRSQLKEIEPADAERREQTRALLARGALRAGEDFRLAAMVFQHGTSPDDYLFAHTLATVALSKGDRSAAWIAAASLDRYLHAMGRPQIYGTQFGFDGTQGAFDTSLVSDPLRAALGVPALADQREQMERIVAN